MARARERLLQAGMEVLLDRGPSASVADITRHAGVCDGSFFTHFASKEDLVRVLVQQRMRTTLAIARKHARAEGPAIVRLEGFAWEAAEDVAPHRAYLQVAERLGALDDSLRETMDELDATLERLIAQAQAARELRAGLSAAEVIGVVMISTAAAIGHHPELWRRQLAFFLAGLRSERRTLPGRAAGGPDFLEQAAAVRRARYEGAIPSR